MTYQTFSRLFVISVITILIAYSQYTYFTADYDKVESVVIAEGTMKRKDFLEYSCGKRNQQSCAIYTASINGKVYDITKDVYFSYNNGDHIALVVDKKIDNTNWEVWSLIMHIGIAIICSIFSLVFMLLFLRWSLFFSNEKPFKLYLKHCGDQYQTGPER